MSDNSFAGINFDDPEGKSIFETHSKRMCPRYKNFNESSFVANLELKKVSNDSYLVKGDVSTNPMSEQLFVKYSAANPPTYNANFSGSGLPYPTEEIAFENTPNRGAVEVINNKFTISIRYPNSYYINMGTVYVAPHIRLILCDKNNKEIGEVQYINLGEGIPFRTLSWPVQRNWNKGPEFYVNKDLPVRTQYQILVDSAYPSTNIMPKNFWGVTPPH
jgi:hypothetical protein